jgi:2-polyprenyl-6-hydroxyphenyl methylase/3-demethylubiquinone-9 3-methyltransferase
MPQINNAFYEELGEKWYEECAHPIALLRAENSTRNPWILNEIHARYQASCAILDIGCGAGFLSNALAKAGHQVTGVDLSESSLAVARKYDETQSVHYLKQDAFSLPFPKGSFDVICAMDFLEHIENPKLLLEKVSLLLKPRGLFFFHTFNRNLLSWLLVIKGVEWLVPNTPKHMHVYPLFIKPKELCLWLAEVDLQVEKIRGLMPCFHSLPFWKSLFQRKVDPALCFQFTHSSLSGYVGIANRDT